MSFLSKAVEGESQSITCGDRPHSLVTKHHLLVSLLAFLLLIYEEKKYSIYVIPSFDSYSQGIDSTRVIFLLSSLLQL